MNLRRSRLFVGSLVVASVALVASQAWAIYFALGPSKDEWGLKYDVSVEDAGPDTVNVKFTLADEGRLKPIHSVSLAVVDKQNSSPGSTRFDVKGKLALQSTEDGKRVGQIQLRKNEVDLGMIRVLTQYVDGQFQRGGASYYDIPLSKQLNKAKAPGVASPAAKAKQ